MTVLPIFSPNFRRVGPAWVGSHVVLPWPRNAWCATSTCPRTCQSASRSTVESQWRHSGVTVKWRINGVERMNECQPRMNKMAVSWFYLERYHVSIRLWQIMPICGGPPQLINHRLSIWGWHAAKLNRIKSSNWWSWKSKECQLYSRTDANYWSNVQDVD
jgi:hypothetical protein